MSVTRFAVVIWKQNGLYTRKDVLREFVRETAASKYADKLAAEGRNAVVRDTDFLLSADREGPL